MQPLGSLALVNTQVVDSEQTIWGVPGRWAPLAAGESGLKVIAEAADGIHVDGELVDGEAIVRGKDDPSPSEIVFSPTVRGFVIAQEGGSYALRVWDAKSEGIRNFGGIDAFAYDPAWVITGAWSDNPEGTTMGFEHLKDDGHTREEVDPRPHHVLARRRRLRHRRVQVGPSAAARVRRRDQRRQHLQRRALPLRRAERRRHDHPRLQPRRDPALRVQLRVQLPAAAQAEPLPVRRSRPARRTPWRPTARCCTSRQPVRSDLGENAVARRSIAIARTILGECSSPSAPSPTGSSRPSSMTPPSTRG